MCTPALLIAGVSAAATVGGAIMSSSAQANVANAQMNAARQTQIAQNTGFMQRLSAQADQNQRDYATQQSAIQARGQAQQDLETSQNAAVAERERQIASSNQQSQQVGSQAQQAVADAAKQVDLQNAQKAQQAQIQQLAASQPRGGAPGTGPNAAPPDASGNPAAVAAPTSNETASAIATRLAQAAAATRDYAGARATLASYAAPIAQLAQTTTNLNTASLPLADRERQLQTALPIQLEPSTTAYGTARNYYKNLLDVIQTRTQGRLNVSSAIGQGDINNADLQQADISNAAQNQAARAAWQAASNPLPGILSGIGQVVSYGAGYLGAGQGLSNLFTPATEFQYDAAGNVIGASGGGDNLLTSIRNWAQKPFIS
jgi:hypothetical protein